MYSSLLSLGAFALTANSFLVPLEVVEDTDISQNFEALIPHSQKVQLDCSTCPFALKSDQNGHHGWTNDIKSDLEMEFSTEGGKISLNGKPFYPINFPYIPPALSVKQVRKADNEDPSAETVEAYDGDLTMSYSLEVTEKHFSQENANGVVIVMTIMGLEGQMINVDNIEICVLKQNNSKVTIPLCYSSSLSNLYRQQ